MSHPYDHATTGNTLLVYNMVRNRLPSIADNAGNMLLLSNFTWELMNQLEVCFQIATAKGTIPEDLTRIGHEENYSALQQSILADLVACLILMMNLSSSAGGSSSTGTGTFLKAAKAGSAEVEYDQIDSSKIYGSVVGKESLLNFYKKGAINKASQLGCVIEICDDCSINVGLAATTNIQPFITFHGGDCHGCGG